MDLSVSAAEGTIIDLSKADIQLPMSIRYSLAKDQVILLIRQTYSESTDTFPFLFSRKLLFCVVLST